MENFVDSYLRMFYEGIIGETKFNNQYIGKIELDNFFKNIIIVNDDLISEDKNVIFENKNAEYGVCIFCFWGWWISGAHRRRAASIQEGYK